jgi:tRNA 2-thiouridine synthesizing protein A
MNGAETPGTAHGDGLPPASGCAPAATADSTVSGELDTRGLCCPEPVMLLHGRVRALRSGEELTVLATDPSTQRDIPRFCEFLGHTLLESSARDGEFVYRIRKGG